MVMYQWCIVKGNELRRLYQQSSDKCSSLMMNDVRLLKAAFLFVFILGLVCSIFMTLFLDLFRTSSEPRANTKVKVFLPYPLENHIESHRENTKESLELSVRKADLEPSGNNCFGYSFLCGVLLLATNMGNRRESGLFGRGTIYRINC